MKTLFASRTPVNSTRSSPWSVVVVMPACRPTRTLALLVCGIAVATLGFFQPPIPSLLRASPPRSNNAGRLLYYGTGRSASVVVLERDGSLAFRTNGLPEALVEMKGSAPHLSGAKWLMPLALLTRPEVRK